MAGRSFSKKNFEPGNNNQFNASGKNRDYYTFESFPGAGAYATGGSIIDGGDGYVYHVFLASGAFTVTQPSTYIDSVDYLIIAGGGAGGVGLYNTHSGAGGGAGGLRRGSINVANQTTYPVVVGAGGTANTYTNPSATRSGSNSSAFSITATGGGGGGSYAVPNATTAQVIGSPGGSGGGTSYPGYATGAAVDVTPRQGRPGGEANPSGFGGGAGPTRVAGGGGGAAGTANRLVPTAPYEPHGFGGRGLKLSEFPASVVAQAIPTALYPSWHPYVNDNGYANGGKGQIGSSLEAPSPALANTGNGGNGNNNGPLVIDTHKASNGGSGLVVIRYLKKFVPTARATGGIVEPSTNPTHLGVFRHIFTSPGTFTVTDPGLTTVDILTVAGGGGGGQGISFIGGGGGAGGFFSTIHNIDKGGNPFTPWQSDADIGIGKPYPVTTTDYPVVIGAGGASGPSAAPGQGTPGGNTTFGAPGPMQIIAIGGGGGGAADDISPPFIPIPGLPGGSGGGTGRAASQPLTPPLGSLGAGTSLHPIYPTLNGTQGYPSVVANSPLSVVGSSGGGGAGGQGGSTPPIAPWVGGAGGIGWYSVLAPPAYGTPGPVANYRYFAGGGGGMGGGPPGGLGGAGGAGGGGVGRAFGGNPTPTINGVANTGGGGGGGGNNVGSGGSGIVIIQYPE